MLLCNLRVKETSELSSEVSLYTRMMSLMFLCGQVIERERSEDEMDGLRYYVDGTIKPLWEEWFHCYDLGTQLGPVIKK